MEQVEAEIRCSDYEHGRDPETAPAQRRRETEARRKKWRPIFWTLILVFLWFGYTAGYPIEPYLGNSGKYLVFVGSLLATIFSGMMVFG
ncbi:MAG: hypothetical protein HFG09_08060 [Oscillibacter sp.]|nr:hypothetical protein [Oscillibacter sp.]